MFDVYGITGLCQVARGLATLILPDRRSQGGRPPDLGKWRIEARRGEPRRRRGGPKTGIFDPPRGGGPKKAVSGGPKTEGRPRIFKAFFVNQIWPKMTPRQFNQALLRGPPRGGPKWGLRRVFPHYSGLRPQTPPGSELNHYLFIFYSRMIFLLVICVLPAYAKSPGAWPP